eukprot:59204-Lingulodinium_polyedra.AAC.1
MWRARHADLDGRPAIVVINRAACREEYAWQGGHELECLRRLNDHRFRVRVIKLLRVYHDDVAPADLI